jgi:hypothetical protein
MEDLKERVKQGKIELEEEYKKNIKSQDNK